MSDIDTTTWSETAASNNAATPNGWPEGQAPSTVNDCAREMMGALKREWDRSHPTVTSSGTNTVTLTYTTAPAAYVVGHTFSFIVGTTNTGAVTINVNALGAKNLRKYNNAVALDANDLIANQVAVIMYDGTQFLLVSTLSGGMPLLPVNSQSAAYTTVLADAWRFILHPTADNNARTFTIDSNANVAYPVGTTLVFVNQINTVTIAITADTLTLSPGGGTGSRTLAASGMATALKVTSTLWFISGPGLT